VFGRAPRTLPTDLSPVQRGWLNSTKVKLVEIKLFENAVHLWRRKHQDLAEVLVKVTAVDVQRATSAAAGRPLSFDEDSVDVADVRERAGKPWPAVDVAVRDRRSEWVCQFYSSFPCSGSAPAHRPITASRANSARLAERAASSPFARK